MDYRKLIQTVADEYNTTPEEVEKEIKDAIRSAGLNITPKLFIALITAKIKKDYIS